MSSKTEQYRILVTGPAPRWGHRFLTRTFGTKAVADEVARSLPAGYGRAASVTVIHPFEYRDAVIEARAGNLHKALDIIMTGSIATDYDDAEPRLRKAAQFYYSFLARNENNPGVSTLSAGKLCSIRRDALGTAAGLRFLYEYKQLLDDSNRIGNYEFTADENRRANLGLFSAGTAMDELNRRRLDMCREFATATVHSDEL